MTLLTPRAKFYFTIGNVNFLVYYFKLYTTQNLLLIFNTIVFGGGGFASVFFNLQNSKLEYIFWLTQITQKLNQKDEINALFSQY